MKKTIILSLAFLFIFVASVQASLINYGVDTLGNRLIYDDDLDITWYDFSNSLNSWDDQVAWADALSVEFKGHILDDWRLPSTVNQDGSRPCFGYNCTDSDMGHLFYTELGGTAGALISSSVDPDLAMFENLLSRWYWSGTEYSGNPAEAFYFSFSVGLQGPSDKGSTNLAMAVRSGAPIPEPTTMLLLGTGLVGVVGTVRKRKKKQP